MDSTPAAAIEEDILLDSDFIELKRIPYEKLYLEYPVNFSKSISKRERESNNDLSAKLVYGEISFQTFAICLEKIKTLYGKSQNIMQNPGGIFYDIGSGSGKPVIAASLLHPFERAAGIEILTGLHKVSILVAAEYKTMIQTNELENYCPEIDFICGNATECDWSNADVVFMNSTCFDDTFMQELAVSSNKLKPGAIVITTTKEIPSPHFEILEMKLYKMSWGSATIFIQQRN